MMTVGKYISNMLVTGVIQRSVKDVLDKLNLVDEHHGQPLSERITQDILTWEDERANVYPIDDIGNLEVRLLDDSCLAIQLLSPVYQLSNPIKEDEQ